MYIFTKFRLRPLQFMFTSEDKQLVKKTTHGTTIGRVSARSFWVILEVTVTHKHTHTHTQKGTNLEKLIDWPLS